MSLLMLFILNVYVRFEYKYIAMVNCTFILYLKFPNYEVAFIQLSEMVILNTGYNVDTNLV